MGAATDAYLKAKGELADLATAASKELGFPLCSRCGEAPATNSMTRWSGGRCNRCASEP